MTAADYEGPEPGGGMTALCCRWCGEPVRVLGKSTLSMSMRPAVHAVTGAERGPGPGKCSSHLAAPIDAGLVRAAAACKAGERP